MKLKFLQFLFLLFLIVFTACESEPENTPLVANDLVKINVPAGFIDNSVELYALASDFDGAILDYKKLSNNESALLSNDTYALDKFMLSLIQISTSSTGEKRMLAVLFSEVEKNEEIILPEKSNQQEMLMSLTSNSDNTAYLNAHFAVSILGGDFDYIIENKNSLLKVNQESFRVFISKFAFNGNIHYIFPPTFYSKNSNVELDFEDFNGQWQNFETEYIVVPEALQSVSQVLGYDNDVQNAYVVSWTHSIPNENNMNILYPGTVFPHYASINEVYRFGNLDYMFTFNKTAKHDFYIPSVNYSLDYNFQNRTLTYSFSSENLAFAYTYLSQLDENYYSKHSWSIILNEEQNSTVKLPFLPQELLSKITDYNPDEFIHVDELEVFELENATNMLNLIHLEPKFYKTIPEINGRFMSFDLPNENAKKLSSENNSKLMNRKKPINLW